MPHKRITTLKNAIRATHGCESLHVKSVPVTEVFEGKVAWKGKVEVFDLVGHPKAKRAYAWSYRDGDKTEIGCGATTCTREFPTGRRQN